MKDEQGNFEMVKTFSTCGMIEPEHMDGSTHWRAARVYVYYHQAFELEKRFQVISSGYQYFLPNPDAVLDTHEYETSEFYQDAQQAEHFYSLACIRALSYVVRPQLRIKDVINGPTEIPF